MEETLKEIEKQYLAALDSVNLINKLKSKENLTKIELDDIDRNVRHLIIMLDKDFWTTEDLSPLQNAII